MKKSTSELTPHEYAMSWLSGKMPKMTRKEFLKYATPEMKHAYWKLVREQRAKNISQRDGFTRSDFNKCTRHQFNKLRNFLDDVKSITPKSFLYGYTKEEHIWRKRWIADVEDIQYALQRLEEDVLRFSRAYVNV